MSTKQKRIRENSNSQPPGFSTGKTVWALAWLAQSWENLWPRLVPAFIVTTLFVTVSWAGLWQFMPDWTRWVVLAGFAIALLASLYPLRNFSFPAKGELLRRIELASGFKHRPVTAQIDKPANSQDSFATALWEEHRKRAARELGNLTAGTARPNGNRFDRFALRSILPIFAFIALGYSFSLNGGRILDAIQPRINTVEVLSRLDVWLTPPAYTAKAPTYLSDIKNGFDEQNNPVQAPVTRAVSGSELTIRYVGDEKVSARLREQQNLSPLQPDEDADGSSSGNSLTLTRTMERSANVEILVREEVIASWPLEIFPDAIPNIELTEAPGKANSGALELNYSVEDDYGVVSARGMIRRLAETAPDARPLVEAPQLQLPLPRARAKSGTTKVNRDFSDHPWAGSEVELTLEATDDPGQIGRSAPVKITLPGRIFVDPMAKALVEQRRILGMDANSSLLVANMLDAVTTHPDIFEIEAGVFLALQTAYRKIADNDSDDDLRDAMDILWETALALELGDLSEVERKLREAQEKLSEALENNASDEEIERLMDELRQAMNDFLEQLAREMAKNPIQNNPLNNMDNTQTLTQRDLERMMERIEDLAKSGSKDAARELLSQMQRMMDNLRAGQHQQQRQQEGNQLNQSLDKLAELMQRQQELMDESFSMQRRQQQMQQQQQNGQNNQEQQQQGQNGQQQQRQDPQNGEDSGEAQSGQMTTEEFEEALRQLQEQQKALEQELSQLGQQLEDLGLDPSEGFGEAEQEMAEAGRNLGKGNPGEAAGDQGQALEALRKGAQSMMQQMAGDRNQGGQQPGQQGQNGRQRMGGTDPLGRRNEANGRVDEGDTRVPGEIDAQRAREIMDAIRKRLSDPLRPLLERDYLDRLLKSE